MKNRAWSTLDIKAVSEDGGKRTFTGIASTPSTDRSDDVVVPTGAQYKLPLPLCWQHDTQDPIGWVTAARVSDKGIEVDCEVADVAEPGPLKDRLTLAWQMLKAKLVRGLSIGFTPVETTRIEGTYGIKYAVWEWLELSPVTVAANQDASITSIKSIDIAQSGAPSRQGVVRLDRSPGVSGTATIESKATKGTSMKTIQEQITAFEAKRAATAAQLQAIVTKSLESGETLDKDDKAKSADLKAELAEIDDHIGFLKDAESIMVTKAAPVRAVSTAEGAESRAGGTAVLSVKSNLPPGVEFARYVKCLANARGNRSEALDIAKARYPDQPRIQNVLKAAVNAGTTTDATWAGSMIDYQNLASEFIEFLRPMTIIGKFGVGAIPGLRRVPFNVQMGGQTSGGAGYWVGQGAPKPLTKFDFANMTLRWAKVANIAVLSNELIRFSGQSGLGAADALVRDALAAAINERIDIDFIDPSKAAVTDVSPASILNGTTPVASGGNTAAAIRADAAAAMQRFVNANMNLLSGVWIMSAQVALQTSILMNALGQKEFPELNMTGGTFMGLPVIVSQYVPHATAGGIVALVSAQDIFLADDGQVVIDASTEASLQMMDNPTNNSGNGTATSMVSMFQTNSTAILAERFINWAKRRVGAAVYISGVNWGE